MSLHKKKAATQKDIEALTQGKTTVGTLLKNKDDVGGMANRVESTERDMQAT